MRVLWEDQGRDVHNFRFDLVDPSDLGRFFRVVPFVAPLVACSRDV